MKRHTVSHPQFAGLCMMPLSSALLFLHRSWPPINPAQPRQSFSGALSAEEEGRVQLWQKAVSTRQQNQSKLLSKNTRGKKKRGLGEAFAIIAWRGGCSGPEAERRKAAETVKFVKVAQGSWIGKQKFNLALLRGVRQNNGSSSLELQQINLLSLNRW